MRRLPEVLVFMAVHWLAGCSRSAPGRLHRLPGLTKALFHHRITAWGIALSRDGKMLFTANGPSNDVSVVDTATNTIVKKLNVGDGPWGVTTVAQ